MINSMTGFGRSETSSELFNLNCEVSSLNRKQLEIQINAPRELQFLEPSIRALIAKKISRGRILVVLQIKQHERSSSFEAQNLLLGKYRQLIALAKEQLAVPLEVSLGDLLQIPEVQQALGSGNLSQQQLAEQQQPVEACIERALDCMLAMRASEGAHLQQELQSYLQQLEAFSDKVATLAPQVLVHHRQQLLLRLGELELNLGSHDERIVRELAIFADRCDISEELVRLQSHYRKFEEMLQATQAQGRSLDFLCQELMREWNTIASKANDSGIAHQVVAAKTVIEKLREQVQNIE